MQSSARSRRFTHSEKILKAPVANPSDSAISAPSRPPAADFPAADLLITRLPSITLRERISLARRAPASVAAALLLDREARVWQAALQNPRLTEAAIVKALHRSGVTDALVAFLCRHPKWSLRPEIRVALLLNEKTPLAHALTFARTLPPAQLRNILHVSHLPAKVKTYLKETVRAQLLS